MSELGYVVETEDGTFELVIPGDTCCVHSPFSTCADMQARSPTWARSCDFCLYGPPDIPARDDSGGMSFEEAHDRVQRTERAAGERLREAVVAAVGGTEQEHER